jgi:hypothetical protein
MGQSLQPASASTVQTRTTLRQRIERHESLAAVVALSLVLFVAYADIVFFGDSLAYSNNLQLLDYRIDARTHGPHARPASTWSERNLLPTANLQDPGATWTQWETGGELLERSVRQFELPFWDPYSGGGVPAMTNLTQAFFFPPYFLLVALGNGVLLKNVYFLALLLAAGWSTWALLHRCGLSWSSSYFGGIAFMLSGGLTQTAGSFIGQTASCLPLALLVTRWFLERSSWAAVGMLGLVYAAIALASFPPILVAIFGLCVAYVAAELVAKPSWLRHPPAVVALRFAVGAGLGLSLVACYYLPAFSLMNLTPQVTVFYRDASSQTIVYARDLLQLLAPALAGGARIWINDPVPHFSSGAFHYVGVVTLITAALVGRLSLRKPLWFVALAGSVVCIGLMLAVPPLAQLRELPGLRNIHFGNYYGIVLDFLVALLAAAGLERLTEARVATLRAWLAIGLTVLGLIAILLAAIGWNIASHPGFADWRSRYVVLVGITFAAATVVFGSIAARPRPGVVGVWSSALLVLLVAEGIFNSRFPRQERWDSWSHPPAYVEYLQREAGPTRVFTMGSALFANSGSAFGIIQLDSLMTFNPPRMFELYRLYARGQSLLFLRDADQVPPEAVLDAACVSYLVIPTGLDRALADVRSRGHELTFEDGGFNIFRRKGLPRYFFTSEYQVSSPEGALKALALPRPERAIVVESAPPFASRANLPDNGSLKVEHFSNNYVRLSLVAARMGFVYASEAFFPGWEARVNGRIVPIEPANFAFRAVPVPPGAVTVELTYTPPGLIPGLGISVAGLLVCGALLASAGRAPARAVFSYRWARDGRH